MIKQIYDKLSDSSTVVALLVAVAVIATILTIAMPLLDSDSLDKRMKSVASEREKIRARERERLAARDKSVALRIQPKAYMRQLVDNFSLEKWLGTEEAKLQLTMAGFRGRQAEVAFLFFRAIAPIGLFVITSLYMFLMFASDVMFVTKIGAAIAATYLGLKAPELFLKNKISKRQASMRRAFPDAMDLILICVESGMSIEHAFRKVSSEIGIQSIEMAEEFALTTAELSYLPDRRQAYENLGVRTGVEGLKQVSTVLIQAEKYGTPLGQALRVVAQEGRDARLLEAERKAAALPPKLTVPMIVFFLPVLFAVILTPALIQMSEKLM
ncbi:MAG: type II secretion system F family protein [Methylobacteriaceae bacterium]|nr:type II secretion system F family protein [Rhodoblastus sp.]MCC0005894.1 type II secretion system F family protein [Methylobacteriaceae bacterium]